MRKRWRFSPRIRVWKNRGMTAFHREGERDRAAEGRKEWLFL